MSLAILDFFSPQLQPSKFRGVYRLELKKAIMIGDGIRLTFCVLVSNRDFYYLHNLQPFLFTIAQVGLTGSLKF